MLYQTETAKLIEAMRDAVTRMYGSMLCLQQAAREGDIDFAALTLIDHEAGIIKKATEAMRMLHDEPEAEGAEEAEPVPCS